MLPVYIFYSMFGFQRVGDLIWAAADQRARGFLIGATAGRTTLAGEGLQHQDGSSHLLAATIPNCRAYDPAFAYEMAVILDHGVRSMMEQGKDEFYYITAMNEKVLSEASTSSRRTDRRRVRLVRLLGSGAILPEVDETAKMLDVEWSVPSEVWSATSYSELATTRGRPNGATSSIRSMSRSSATSAPACPAATSSSRRLTMLESTRK